MIYFIPAWYQGNEWREQTLAWYEGQGSARFDDTIKQVQIFTRNRLYPCRLLLLSYEPNLRRFLHRQSIYHVDRWSAFDAIQCASGAEARAYSFHDLAWPAGTEFLYSSFVVLAYLEGTKYARVEFGEDGDLVFIRFYDKDERISRMNYYDDRGFLSSTVLYKDGRQDFEQYLDPQGTWKIARTFSDGRIFVNPESAFYEGAEGQTPYRKTVYDSLEEVLSEVTSDYTKNSSPEDIFCIAMHPRHTNLLLQVLTGKKKILSFYEGRKALFPEEASMEEQILLRDSWAVISDTEDTGKLVRQRASMGSGRVEVIPPFDSRVQQTESLNYRFEDVLFMIDHLEPGLFSHAVRALAGYMMKNDRVEVRMYTRAERIEKENIQGRVKEALEGSAFEDMGKRFLPAFVTDGMSASRLLRSSRILVDLAEVPEAFAQVSALSMGIPQVAFTETEYLRSGEDGAVIHDTSELPEVLAYYLEDIAHWNDAMIASYEMGRRFSSGEIIRKWKDIIESVEGEHPDVR